MGFFKNMLGSNNMNESNLKLNWTQLTDLKQLDELVSISEQKSVLIFKHSSRCSVSRMALKQFENEFKYENEINLYYLDLLEFRSISNAITAKFKIEHQSPQVLLIKDNVAIYNTSHSEIDATELGKYL